MKTLRECRVKGTEVMIRLVLRPDGSYTVTKIMKKRLEFTEFVSEQKAKAHYDQLMRETKE